MTRVKQLASVLQQVLNRRDVGAGSVEGLCFRNRGLEGVPSHC
jgi:hypothetical protein